MAPERTTTLPCIDSERVAHQCEKGNVVLNNGGAGSSSSNNKISGPRMKQSVSMLEMNEIDDMKHFFYASDTDRSLEEECHGGNLLGGRKTSAPTAAGEEEENDFFFDAEESDDDVDYNLHKMEPSVASSSDTKISNSSSSGGMRRVQSRHNDNTNNREEQLVQVNFGDDADDSITNQKPPKHASSSNSLRGSLRSSSHSLNSSGHPSGLSSSQHSQPQHSSMKKSTSQASMKRSSSNVSFGELEIRSYNITVGDAPTPNGVPLSLDWSYDPEATQTIDVDTYEEHRGERRGRHEMYVPNQYRVYLLMRDAGLTRRQIKQAIDESQRSFKNRQKTLDNLKMQRVEEALEKTKRRFLKITRRLSEKR